MRMRRRTKKKRSTFKRKNKSSNYNVMSSTRRALRRLSGISKDVPASTKMAKHSAQSSMVFRTGKYSESHAHKLKREREERKAS